MVYGKEVIIPMEYIVPSLCIAVETSMDDVEALEECIVQCLKHHVVLGSSYRASVYYHLLTFASLHHLTVAVELHLLD